MAERALVDWGSEDLLPQGRQIDDWTAGDDLDFTVRHRRRITGEHPVQRTAPRGTDHATLRPVTAEHGVQRTRAPHRGVIVEVDAPPQPDARPRAAVGSIAAGEERRTVAITGRPELRHTPARLREVEARRRPTRSPVDQAMSRPDRIALWAVGLGFLLILIAALSGGA